jgi:uncharacterized membrane protein (DUF4010 family)
VSTLDLLVVRDFAIALLVGVLIGIEREKRKDLEGDISIAGLRTFALFAEAGALSAWLSRQLGTPWIFIATLLGISLATVAGYLRHTVAQPAAVGLTTEVAALVTCLLGGTVMYGYAEVAVVLAIGTSALLAFKQPLHHLVGRIGLDDLYAGVKLLVASFVVLPLLPNRAIDPWGALNPYELWLLVILISGLSLVGYVAVRWLGTATGSLLTGLFGGLVSSTAVSLAFARRSREPGGTGPEAASALAAGVLIAWAVMFVRVMIEVAVVHPPLLPRLVTSFGLMAASTALCALAFFGRSSTSQETTVESAVVLRNPFSMSSAFRFALFFAVVLLLVELAQRHVPAQGVYVVAALAGLTDVDAITLSMAAFARDGGSTPTAIGAIVIAAIINTLVKTGMVVALGSRHLARRVAVAAAVVLLTGLFAFGLA